MKNAMAKVIGLAFVVSCLSTQAALLAYEGFDTINPIGTDVTAAGLTGTGFSGYTETHADMDLQAGLSYTDSQGNQLVNMGRSAGLSSAAASHRNLQLVLANPIADTDTYYMSFLIDYVVLDAWTSMGFGQAVAGSDVSYGNAHAGAVSRLDTSFKRQIYAPNGVKIAGATETTGPTLVILKVDRSAHSLSVYWNPSDLTDVVGTAEGSLSAVGTAAFPDFIAVALGVLTGGEALVDEIRIGDSLGDVVPLSTVKTILEYTEQEFLDTFLNLDIEGSLIAGHPRLFLTPDRFDEIMLDAAKAGMITNDFKADIEARMLADDWTNVTASNYWMQYETALEADKLVAGGANSFEPNQHAIKSAVVYLATGDQQFADYAEWLMNVSLLSYEKRVNLGYAFAWAGFTRLEWLIAYDLVYNGLSAGAQEDLLNRYISAMDFFMANSFTSTEVPRESRTNVELGNYGAGFLRYYIPLMALDKSFITETFKSDTLRPWLDVEYENYLKFIYYRAQSRGEFGGASATTLSYSFSAYPYSLINFMHASRSAWGQDFVSITPELLGLSYYVIWNMIMGVDEEIYQYGSGDLQRSENEFPGGQMALHMKNYLALYGAVASPEQKDSMNYVRGIFEDHINHPYYSLFGNTNDIFESTSDSDTLPKAFYFKTMGQLFSKSAYASNGTYAMFMCGGEMTAHRHRDSLHFTLYKEGFQALDSGNRPGYSDTYHWTRYAQRSVAHNMVLVHTLPSGNEYGGQLAGTHGDSTLESFVWNDNFSYMAGNGTDCYDSNRVNEVSRQFLHIYPSLFLVFDRVEADEASFRKDWLLHFGQPPTVSTDDNSFSGWNGGGRLYGKTLLPAAVDTTIIEGFKRNDATEYPLLDWDGLTDAQKAVQGKWRIDVTPKVATERDYFLHLLQLGDEHLEELIPYALSEDAGSATVSLDYAGNHYTIQLDKTGALGGSIEVVDAAGQTNTVALLNTIQSQTEFLPASVSNRPPVFTVDPFTMAETSGFQFYSGSIRDTAMDADLDALVYSKTSGPAWLTIAPDGTLGGMPASVDAGLNSFTVQVSDGQGGTDNAEMTITVNAGVNSDPVFVEDPMSRIFAIPGKAYVATLAGSAVDTDAGHLLTYSKVAGPSWLSVASDGTLGGIPASLDDGLNLFRVQVSDAFGGTATAGLTIRVYDGLLAYEGFDAVGNVRLQKMPGGVGFTNNPTLTNYRMRTYDSAGLSYLDGNGNTLDVEGQYGGLDAVIGGTKNLQLELTGGPISTGTVYMSFLFDANNATNGFYVGLLSGAVGASSSMGSVMQAMVRATSSGWGNYGNPSGINDVGGPTTAGLHFVVSAINLDTGTMTTYFDPTNLSDVAGSASHTIDSTGATFSPITHFGFGLGANIGYVDEIRIGNNMSIVVPIVGVPVTPYEFWSVENGLANGVNDALTADPDGDGNDNLMEYAVDGDPLDAAAGALMFIGSDGNASHWFYHVHNQRTDDGSLTYRVETGTDLASSSNWTVGGVEFVGESPSAGNYKSVTNRTDIENQEFIRLKIERQ
ncbi:putative Ig domain-containing protein [Pontiella sulfatireligans]|uniref:Heparin and heparin-sulfate lyase n=1 Tax=Pontiella sulfatireligans TaxID=2750658 RepID=A0A6C2UI21_9BACT|nr:putative Ig domain-containing protein [Pontiella sulfatireligans]VGO19107.1 Heparin and heparin-sulfate lyase [Pontiella sulfatireligans]